MMKRSIGFAGIIAMALLPLIFAAIIPSSAFGQYNQQRMKKICNHCGREVPYDSQVGDRCPYCGAVWTAINTEHKSHPKPWLLAATFSKYSYDNFLNYTGLLYGFEVGIDRWGGGPMLMLKYRMFHRAYTDSASDLNHINLELGYRLNNTRFSTKHFSPFLGLGIGWAVQHSSDTASTNPTGPGLYLEGGLELRFTRWLSLAGLMEYSLYRMSYTNYADNTRHHYTEGKIYPKGDFIISFHR